MPEHSTPVKRPMGRPRKPRTNKKMHLNLNPEVHRVLMEFSQATGQPAATFVVEVLNSSVGQIKELTLAALAVKQAPAVAGPALNRLSDQLTQAQADVAQLRLELVGGAQ